MPLLASLDELLVRLLSLLSAAHVRELALLLLYHLSTLSPQVASYLLDCVAPQLCDFTPVELLYLARRYAPAEAAVLSELRGRDIARTMDVADFVRVARDVPPAVSAVVVAAFCPSLSFAWATRVLSALSARPNPGAVPPATVCALAARLDALSCDATAAERHSAAAVLQRFAAQKTQHTENTENAENAENTESAEHTESAEMIESIERVRDRLLVVSAVDSPAALNAFLAALPDELRDAVRGPLDAQIAAAVLPALSRDGAALLALCQQLQRRRMLTPALRGAVAAQFTTSGEAQKKTVTNAQTRAQLATALALIGVLFEAPDGDAAAAQVLRTVRERYDTPADRLTIVAALVEQQQQQQQQQQSHSSQRAAAPCSVRQAAMDLCDEALRDAAQLSPSDYARLLQCASRLRCLPRAASAADFGIVFRHHCAAADAHSRCVAFKALSTAPRLFRAHEAFVVPLLRDTADVLAPEDLEMVLGAVLELPLSAALEALLDAVGTRVLLTLGQCRRSTLVRVLQCHAAFALEDDALVARLLDALAEQCAGRDARLDTAQALTLLQATVDLRTAVPERLAVACFAWLEQQVDTMTIAQLGHAARLAVEVEMGYTGAVHAIATRALEQREAIRANAAFREAAEMLCDEFSVELPFHLRAAVMRRRYQTMRLNEYYDRRRADAQSSAQEA